jgi:glucan phosphoethanolaminetransferase (alkaline phosphatase superfamily)
MTEFKEGKKSLMKSDLIKKINNSSFIKYIFLELIVMLICVKIYAINFIIINHHETLFNGILQTIAHDAYILFFIVLFSYLSFLNFFNLIFIILFRIISFILLALYLTDMLVMKMFMTHIVLDDIFKYISYLPKYITQMANFNILNLLLVLLSLIFSLLYIKNKVYIKQKIEHFVYIFILTLLIIFSLFANSGYYVHSWIFKNFIEYNIEVLAQNKVYSKKFIDNLQYKEIINCKKSEKHNKNIIILMVESLATYQSKYFSDIKDFTPNLDAIAKNNISFLNFYSNGFMTEDAEISILTGLFPIYAPKIFSDGGGVSFNGFYNINDSLPNILNRYNYNTEFITSADLNFSNTNKWAKSLGFKYIEGSQHPYYNDKKRYHFKAASDEYLYHRVLSRIKNQKDKYFLFIKTVSSHVPFINPINEHRSEEQTIKYVDKQIGKFYKSLKKINFFDNGILIIVGDHHPLIPLKDQQISKYGAQKASCMVPMIVCSSNNDSEKIDLPFQQTDIYNSIKNYVGKESCISDFRGDFLTKPIIPAKYIMHRRGDQRGIISVFFNKKVYNVKLDGDYTKIIDKQNKQILNKINYDRIQRGKNSIR